MVIVFRCPTCKKTLSRAQEAGGPEGAAFPFCGARCKTIDLGAWLSESYRVVAETPDGEFEVDPEFDSATELAHARDTTRRTPVGDAKSSRGDDGDKGWMS